MRCVGLRWVTFPEQAGAQNKGKNDPVLHSKDFFSFMPCEIQMTCFCTCKVLKFKTTLTQITVTKVLS